ncbi:MAG: hypothetical protein AAGA02_12720 [Bacteroidota bacterium]
MSTVVIFGAGATKACGGPLTNEILFNAFNSNGLTNNRFTALLNEFLIDNFHLSRHRSRRTINSYPGLPLLISLVDTAINRNQPFNNEWNFDRMLMVREALEYVIFAIIKKKLEIGFENHYYNFLQKIFIKERKLPTVVSLNYDIIVDNALIKLMLEKEDFRFVPNYGCEISSEGYKERIGKADLYKLHGSLNWLYCPACNRLEVGMDKSGKFMRKELDRLYRLKNINKVYTKGLESSYKRRDDKCNDSKCRTKLRPIIITPTHFKDYRNPHVSSVWYNAERALRTAKKIYIIGYSLPEDDIDVIYLLK